MSSFCLVSVRDLRAILTICAPGFDWSATDHFYCVKFNGLTFPSLAKKDMIQGGQIRKMARHLGVLACVLAQLSA